MKGLFEKSDSLNTPIECFIFDSGNSDFPIKPHWHYFAELIFMLDGTAEMSSGDDTFILKKGDLMIFHPSVVHSIYSAEESHLRYAVLKFDINRFSLTPAYAPKLSDIFGYARKTGMRVHFDAKTSAEMECERIFSACLSEMNEYRYGRDLVLQTHIYGLLMNVIRRWLDDGMVIGSNIPHEDSFLINNITEYIDRSLYEDIRVSEIAEKCSLSYSCFAKKFREQYGMSCKQYIERMRIYKAEEFLIFTDYDLNYISQETGFSDCSHLIKCFKKYRGVTPKQYRLDKKGRGNRQPADIQK